jgi:hypothetical protein
MGKKPNAMDVRRYFEKRHAGTTNALNAGDGYRIYLTAGKKRRVVQERNGLRINEISLQYFYDTYLRKNTGKYLPAKK